jgi:hypothetical protein
VWPESVAVRAYSLPALRRGHASRVTSPQGRRVALATVAVVSMNATPPARPAVWARTQPSTSSEVEFATLATLVTASEPGGLLDGLRSGTELDAMTFPPLTWAVEGILPEGVTIFVGPPKVGKSWLLAQIGLACAAGGVALGSIPVEARPVLLLALEDGERRLQSRFRSLAPGEAIPGNLGVMITTGLHRATDVVHEWACLPGNSRGLVIVDTFGRTMRDARPGESAYQRDYGVVGAYKRTASEYPGLSIVLVHHDRKATSDDFVDSVSGTNGLAGAADTVVVLSRPRQSKDGLLRVTGRDVPENEYAVTVTDDMHWHIHGADLAESARAASVLRVTAGLGDDMARVIAAVDRPGVTTSEVVAGLEDMDAGKVRTYLGRAAKEGRLVRDGRGRYSPVPVSHVSQVLQTCEGCGNPLVGMDLLVGSNLCVACETNS